MTITLALAGKGGVGKTTVAGMVIKYLAQNQTGSILAIDADPSANLNMVLGLELEWTVGDIREDMLHQVKNSLVQGGAAMGNLPGGVNKRDYLDYHVRSSLAEGSRFDLIAMGRYYCRRRHLDFGAGLLLRGQPQPAGCDRRHEQALSVCGHR